MSNLTAVGAVEGVDAGVQSGLCGFCAGSFIHDGLGVSGNLGVDHIVHIALVGEVIIGDGRLSAEYVAREGRATRRDVVADREVVLDRQVRREDLTGHRELDTGRIRSGHRHRGSHLELVNVSFSREHSSREIEVIVGLNEIGEVREVTL